MNAIGGYFELADFEEGIFPHQDGILLNTGRNALEYILRGLDSIRCVYLPYFTCNAVIEPLNKLKIPYVFYHINKQFEIDDQFILHDRDYIIVNNYFGIKDTYINNLAEKYGDKIIVDCAQAFFARPIYGVKSFYSARKFVGVADGGIAYLGNDAYNEVNVIEIENTKEHCSHLYTRKYSSAEAGFDFYKRNERALNNQNIRWMSGDTKRILDHIDYDTVVARRLNNYKFLCDKLHKINALSLPEIDTFSCPMVYPFVCRDCRDLRMEFIENKVYVAKYWPNVVECNNFKTEFYLANNVIPIPCDHRYGEKDMERIIKIVNR